MTLQKRTVLYIKVSALFAIINGFNPILDICSSAVTQQDVIFNENTQFSPVEYESEDVIQKYDNIENNGMMDWPHSHNIWGFKASSITMTNGEKQLSENILISSIPIYFPDDNKPRSIAKPRGKYFYVFSSESSSNEEFEAIKIEFRSKDEPNRIHNFKIMTKPTLGANDDDSSICDTAQTEGMCFGESHCCNTFNQLLSKGIRKGSACRTILLCPKGVLRIDLYDFNHEAAQNGLDDFAIYGVNYHSSEQDKYKEMQLLFETESNYVCADGSYHIRLFCPRISTSFKGINIGRREKGNIDENKFRECPFCSVPEHKYQIILPSDDIKVRGECSENEKKTRPSFGFMNKHRDFMSCCMQSHTRASNHVKGAYKMHSIKKEIENAHAQKMNDIKAEGRKSEDVFKSENKYEAQQRNEVRQEENKTIHANTSYDRKYDSGMIRLSMTHSVIFGLIVTIIMIVASSYIYFK